MIGEASPSASTVCRTAGALRLWEVLAIPGLVACGGLLLTLPGRHEWLRDPILWIAVAAGAVELWFVILAIADRTLGSAARFHQSGRTSLLLAPFAVAAAVLGALLLPFAGECVALIAILTACPLALLNAHQSRGCRQIWCLAPLMVASLNALAILSILCKIRG